MCHITCLTNEVDWAFGATNVLWMEHFDNDDVQGRDNGIWSRAQECVRFSLRCSRPSWLSSPSSRSTAMKRVEINSLKDALNLVSFVRRATRGACFHVSTRGDESLSGRSYWSERDSVQLWSLPPLRGFCYDMNSHSSLGFRCSSTDW